MVDGEWAETRLTPLPANLVYTLRRQNKRYGVGSACIGGGQGLAVVLERA